MKYSEEDYIDIYESAKLGFNYDQVAMQLGISFSEFWEDYNDSQYQVKDYYKKGQLEAELEVRQRTFSLAKNGSAAAAIQFSKMQQQTKLENRKRELDEY